MKHPGILLSITSIGLLTWSSAGAQPVNLLSLHEGALPIVMPPAYGGWPAENLLDESPFTGWACESGRIRDNVFVYELPSTASVERFEFDNASVDEEGAGARTVAVEVSSTSAAEGFTKVLAATLAASADEQVFPITPAPARWIRLTIADNHGNEEWTELFSFRAFGPRPQMAPIGDISGTYDTDYADFHIRQTGTSLLGCYAQNDGLLDGTIEGRVMKLTWRESESDGPAVMVFAPDGESFRGFWWHRGQEIGGPGGSWDGKKKADTVGGCPHWSGSLKAELHEGLEAEGRVRLYGILFDVDSATIREQSLPILEEVVQMLRAEPSWRLVIEGHTDAVGSESHNEALSQNRAESVRAYLVAQGIEDTRLRAVGFGESRPIADNATELSRAQNRRVELAKE